MQRRGLILVILVALMGCDAQKPMTFTEYCREVDEEVVVACIKELTVSIKEKHDRAAGCPNAGQKLERIRAAMDASIKSDQERQAENYIRTKAASFIQHIGFQPGEGLEAWMARTNHGVLPVVTECSQYAKGFK